MKEFFLNFMLNDVRKKICFGTLIISFLFFLSSFFLPYGIERHWAITGLLGIVTLSLGLLIEALEYKKKIENFLGQATRWRVSCCVCSIVIFGSTLYFGMQQFGGWDFSILVDSAWRLYQGQIPYETFVCTTPPGFVIGGALAFKFFGVRWFSLVLMAAIYGGLTFLWSCWLLKQLNLSKGIALLLAFLLQASTTLLASFWWFNSITTITGVLFFLSAILLLSSRGFACTWFSYLGSLTLLLFMKPNTAGIEVLGITAILFFSFSKKERIKLVLFSMIALVGWAGILSVFNINIGHLLTSYASIAHRAFTLRQFVYNNLLQMDIIERSLMVAIWIIFIILWILPLLIYTARFFTPKKSLSLVAITAGIFATVNNCESGLMNLQLILFGVWSLMEEGRENYRANSKLRSLILFNYSLFVLLCCFLVGLCSGEAMMRTRVKGIGDFFRYTTSPEMISGDFFEGVHASPFFVELHRELTTTLPFYIERKDSIWFGPRLGWAYADFDLSSPADQPVAWEREVFYAPQQEPDLIKSWIGKKFDALVFLRNDVTYLPLELLQFISNNYFLVQQQKTIMIFYRKK